MSVLCPICSADVLLEQTVCPQCGAELDGYLSVYYAPDMLYNEAADLIEKKEYRAAYDKLAAAHFMRPMDKGILCALAHCAACMEDYLGAMEKLATAMAQGSDPTIAQEFARLDKRLSEQQQLEEKRKTDIREVYKDMKQTIAKATKEAVSGLILGAVKPDDNVEV